MQFGQRRRAESRCIAHLDTIDTWSGGCRAYPGLLSATMQLIGNQHFEADAVSAAEDPALGAATIFMLTMAP